MYNYYVKLLRKKNIMAFTHVRTHTMYMCVCIHACIDINKKSIYNNATNNNKTQISRRYTLQTSISYKVKYLRNGKLEIHL